MHFIFTFLDVGISFLSDCIELKPLACSGKLGFIFCFRALAEMVTCLMNH